MVKLFSLNVLRKTAVSVKALKSAHELSSVSYFSRGNVQEFMLFVSKTVVERTPIATRQSIRQGDYMCHVYVRENGLASVLISDHEYPHRVAHSLLIKVLNDFAEQVPEIQWSTDSDTSIFYEKLPVYLAKYQVPAQADAMTKIEEELDETKIILHETIENVLKRGEKMEELVAKSEELSSQSKMFYKTARKTDILPFSLPRQNFIVDIILSQGQQDWKLAMSET